jgi:anti-anti-sigma factor
MDEGRVLHASHQGVQVLRYIGDVRYTLAPSLGRFLEDLFARVRPAGFVIDLQQASGIDSTNLGLLVRIAKHMQELGGPRVTIISGHEDTDEILLALGLDEVFDIVKGRTAEGEDGQMVPVGDPNPQELARTVLAAHRALMALNEQNRDLFQDVVAAFEREGIEDAAPQ